MMHDEPDPSPLEEDLDEDELEFRALRRDLPGANSKFDINKLRIGVSGIPSPVGVLASNLRGRRHRPDQFIRLPMVWADRLDSARFVATAKVAHHLLRQSFKDRRDKIRLANGVLATKGVTPRQKWRALKELEALGLISIENRPRKSPEITLLYPRQGR